MNTLLAELACVFSMRAAQCGRSTVLSLLFPLLIGVSELRLSNFNLKEVANTAWAFARVNYRDRKLFAVFSIEAKWRLREFNPQNDASTAWAFATLNYPDETFFAACTIGCAN
jgi:hypothetical protein